MGFITRFITIGILLIVTGSRLTHVVIMHLQFIDTYFSSISSSHGNSLTGHC